MTRLYEDQNFVKEKALIEEQIMQATTATMESKSFIREMDDFLKDLESWKTKRAEFLENSSQAPHENTQAAAVEYHGAGLAKLEEDFMEKANVRERQIIDQLKAVGIDPTAPREEQKMSVLSSSEQPESNTDYVSIMEQIEIKERLLAQKEQEFKAEAYEEIKLSDDNQAQVDKRKKELEAMLAGMQQLESEFDDLDQDFDDQLGSLLGPEITSLEE